MHRKRHVWFHDPDTCVDLPVMHLTTPEGFSDGERFFMAAGARRFGPGRTEERHGNWTHLTIIHARDAGRAAVVENSRRYVYNIAHRILERGVIPPLSEAVSAVLEEAVRLSRRVPVTIPLWQSPDGSELEELFLKQLVTTIELREVLFFLHFQVPFNLLVPNAVQDQRRVDFAIIHPVSHPHAVVIEVDGIHHNDDADQRNMDRERDLLLRQAGHTVIRFSRQEIEAGAGKSYDTLSDALKPYRFPLNWDEEAAAAGHAQAAVLYALERGIVSPDDSEWSIACTGSWSHTQSVAVHEFVQTLGALGELYGTRMVPPTVQIQEQDFDAPPRGEALRLHWSPLPWFYPAQGDGSSGRRMTVLELRPTWFPVMTPLPAPPARWRQPNPEVPCESLEYLLRVSFPGLDSFRPGQEEAIRRSLAGQDSVVLLPTGAGKSLVFQFSALMMPGVTLAVTPLVSLMEDQVENLRYVGFDRAASISSSDTAARKDRLIEGLKRGLFILCYISPERLQIQEFRNSLEMVRVASPVPQVVVDEAHCVSEWGHDFRPAYLNLGRLARVLGRRDPGTAPAVIGLTGTASRAVLRDVQRELGIRDLEAVITPDSFDRSELSFEVVTIDGKQKQDTVKNILDRVVPQRLGLQPSDLFNNREDNTICGIVFYPHVGGEHGVVNARKYLQDHFHQQIASFAGSDKVDGEQKQREAKDFKANRLNVMVATKAFGMGIDKPNVRYTVHYQLPPSLESFYQEAGRAGRDRNPAHCLVIRTVYSDEHVDWLLSPVISNEEARRRYQEATKEYKKRDDIARNLFFFFNSFRGIDSELQIVREVIKELGDLAAAADIEIPFGDNSDHKTERRKEAPIPKDLLERALHRLILLGLIEDYTVDYRKHSLRVATRALDEDSLREHLFRYISGYSISRARRVIENTPQQQGLSPEEIIVVYVRALIEFIYATVEGGRRSAIRTVWRWAQHEKDDAQLRQELLDYLQETESAKSVFAILREDEFNLDLWSDVVAYIANVKEAQELDTALARALEDYPDHPAVLACRAISSAMAGKTASESRDYMEAAVEFLLTRYGEGAPAAVDLLQWVLDEIRVHKKSSIPAILRGATRITDSREDSASDEARIALAGEVLRKRVGRNGTVALLATLLRGLSTATEELSPDIPAVNGGNSE